MNVWVATRGILHATLEITGRSAHAEVNQPPGQQGGGVNAIDKAVTAIVALRELSEQWGKRADKQHELLGWPAIHPT